MAVGHLGDRPAGRQGPPPPAVGRDSHGRRRDREGRRPSLRPARARRRGRQGRRHGGVPPAQAGGLQLPARPRPDGPAPGFVAGDLVPGGRPRVGAVRSPGAATGGGVPDLEGLSVTPTWPQLISDVIARTDLSADQTEWAMDQVMSGNTSPATLAGFLTALATKGETVAELKGLADAMLAHAEVIEVPTNTLDIVGTGGDRALDTPMAFARGRAGGARPPATRMAMARGRAGVVSGPRPSCAAARRGSPLPPAANSGSPQP